MYTYGVRSTKHLTTDKDGNADYTIKLPALEAGTHKFAFSSYTTVYPPIVHLGLDQSSWAKVNNAFVPNYREAGAYMSVAKTTYTVGEPIHVNYSMKGKSSSEGPWIVVTRSIPNGEQGKEAVVGLVKLDSNENIGQITLKGGMDGCENKDFANLPAGNYKIYFRDFDAKIYDDDGRYWPQCNITDPISITIIDTSRRNDKATQNTFYYDSCHYNDDFYKSYGYISVDKTIFRQGEEVRFTHREYLKSDAVRILLCEANSNTIIDWAWQTNFNENNVTAAGQGNLETANLEPGHYQLMFVYDRELNESIATNNNIDIDRARKDLAFYGVIDIVVIPADNAASPVMNLTYAHQNGDYALNYNCTTTPVLAYNYSRNPITIDVTETDVDNGFVEFKYELKNLVPNADIVYSTEMFYDDAIQEDPYIKDGDYIYFGEYPQTLKSSTITILDFPPDERGYYRGSDGYYYAKVVAAPYNGAIDYTFANGSTPVVNGQEYYFKVEPIKWRILKTGDVYYDVLCESIIANQAYDNESNKYDDSDVRMWLNETFYNTAFSDFQKHYIKQVTVDNSLTSTGYGANDYVCDDTNDKIYLPSYSEVTNTEYKFSSNHSASDPYRIKTVTDYARATGTWTNMSEWDGNMGSGIWMLRSPADSASNFIREGYFNGEITDGGIDINVEAHGVAPMLRIAFMSDESGYNIYRVITDNVGDKTTYRGNYSALLNVAQNPAGNRTYSSIYAASMSVPKTYFAVGEKIPVTYSYNPPIYTNKAYIYIATMGKDDGSVKDSYIRWFTIDKTINPSGTVDLRNATGASQNKYAEDLRNLPAGEYKIWFMCDKYWVSDSSANKVPYYSSWSVTDPISIKIIDPEAPDYSLAYKSWIDASAMYSYIKLEKNVFNQGEDIKMAFNGLTNNMYAFLVDSAGQIVGSTKTSASEKTKAAQLNSWSSFYEMDGFKSLTPGKYKLYYAKVDPLKFNLNQIYNDGAIVTILDITILPKEVTEAPTLKLDVIYTSTAGHTVSQTINENVMLNDLLNSHTGNYDLTDNGNKVEGIVDLTGVKANTDVQFVFYYKDDVDFGIDYKDENSIKLEVDSVPWETYNLEYSSVNNFAITKTGFKYNNIGGNTNDWYNGVNMSVKKTYFNYGEPIDITYNVATYANPRIFITTNDYDTFQKYADFYVKVANVSGSGTVNINRSEYTSIQSDFDRVTNEENWNTLPPGEYKIWLINDAYPKPLNPYATYVDGDYSDSKHPGASRMTEPITIKVIDPNNPDFSLTYGAYAPYSGTYDESQGIKYQNTTITLEKNVFTVGEKIYFTIGEDYGGKHVVLSKAEQFNLSSSVEYTYESEGKFYSTATKGKYWQYAEHGQMDRDIENSLDTTGLEPGQYKLYYMFGQYIQQALRGETTTMTQHGNTAAKVYAIIDITILPKPEDPSSSYTQTVTVNYTKFDGTSATVSSDFNISGKVLNSTYENGKLVNKFHQGIDFAKTITDVKPGTEITISVTTNLPEDVQQKLTPVVLKEFTKTIVPNEQQSSFKYFKLLE